MAVVIPGLAAQTKRIARSRRSACFSFCLKESFFSMKNASEGNFSIEGQIHFNAICAVSGLNLSFLDGIPEASSIQIDGIVNITPFGFSHIVLQITGVISVFINGSIDSIHQVVQTRMLIALKELSGQGELRFEYLTSGFPYESSIEKESHSVDGVFDMRMIPVSPGLIMIFPHILDGFVG